MQRHNIAAVCSRWVLPACIAAVMVHGGVARADCFDPIIFDPSAMAQHVQQVAKITQQVQTAIAQVESQLKELTSLPKSVSPQVAATVDQTILPLDKSLYGMGDVTAQVQARYPTEFSGMPTSDYQNLQAQWNQQYRDALIENRSVQNRVVQSMAQTQGEITQIVQASNAAPGDLAAVQAHNDLLAVLSRELTQLSSVKLVRSRMKADQMARAASEAAYAQQQRQVVRGNWANPPKPSGTMRNPFYGE